MAESVRWQTWPAGARAACSATWSATALEYAERMTYTGQKVDDALFGRLKNLFGEAQIVGLTAAIALENFRSKFNPALGVESQGFCLLPKR